MKNKIKVLAAIGDLCVVGIIVWYWLFSGPSCKNQAKNSFQQGIDYQIASVALNPTEELDWYARHIPDLFEYVNPIIKQTIEWGLNEKLIRFDTKKKDEETHTLCNVKVKVDKEKLISYAVENLSEEVSSMELTRKAAVVYINHILNSLTNEDAQFGYAEKDDGYIISPMVWGDAEKKFNEEIEEIEEMGE